MLQYFRLAILRQGAIEKAVQEYNWGLVPASPVIVMPRAVGDEGALRPIVRDEFFGASVSFDGSDLVGILWLCAAPHLPFSYTADYPGTEMAANSAACDRGFMEAIVPEEGVMWQVTR
jgi:hypothetical protein